MSGATPELHEHRCAWCEAVTGPAPGLQTQAQPSHGICPSCLERLREAVARAREERERDATRVH